jgi:hypothetical protein
VTGYTYLYHLQTTTVSPIAFYLRSERKEAIKLPLIFLRRIENSSNHFHMFHEKSPVPTQFWGDSFMCMSTKHFTFMFRIYFERNRKVRLKLSYIISDLNGGSLLMLATHHS